MVADQATPATMLDRSPLKVDMPLQPQARRRAYSDSGKSVFRPLFRRLASPPPMLCPLSSLPPTPLTTIEAKVPLETPQPTQSIPIPRRNTYAETLEVGSPPLKASSPMSLASTLTAPDSPSQSRYAGMVVGSPLGLGPLNGQHLTALDHSPACSTDNIPATGSPTLMSDLLPMVRPRLPSVSETPSVAPIPENLPLPDSPRRPPLIGSYSLDTGGSAAAAAAAGGGAAKLQQQQQQQQQLLQPLSKIRDGGKKDDGGWASGDEMGGSLGPVPRPRSGTWSLATSRRKEKRLEKEEEARVRRRRKSGDDIHKLATADVTLLQQPITTSGFATRRRNDVGFFDSFRPRSKSDAKAILQARQRRRSGDDPLTTTMAGSREAPPLGPRDRKKEASPGFFESIRPRSKSDAARLANKKPNIMTTMKNAVQHTLVSPGAGGGGGGRGGRRSGENTPPLDARMGATAQHGGEDYHHYTWHAGGADRSSKTSSLFKVFDIFRGKDTDDRKKRATPGKGGERGRRNSGDLNERSRQTSGSLTSVYIRGCDPAGAASVFRESRGLPSADPLLQQLAKEEESQILVKFFQLHRSHDLIPTSAKLVIFDTSLQVKKAFYALVHNGVRAAPLWDRDKQKFVGMLTITDFIRILHSFHLNQDPQMENLEDHRLHMWRTFLKDDDRPLISISPEDSLYEAIRLLIHHKIHRLPVIDPATGNVLYIITHKRILKFLYLYINELPKPQVLQKTIAELGIGTYTHIETATQDTLIIQALDKFVKHRVSALPIVDSDGKLVDIYAKFDVINLAAEGTYNNLNVTLRQANESRNEWFEGVQHCTKDEKLCTVMDRIVRAEVHRLVVVDDSRRVVGVISLSDILKELVLKPCGDENLLKKTSVCDMVKSDAVSPENAPLSSLSSPSPQPPVSPPSAAALLTKSGSEESCGDTDHLTEGIGSPEGGKVSSGDSEDEGRYSMDKSEETPPVPSPEGIPISG